MQRQLNIQPNSHNQNETHFDLSSLPAESLPLVNFRLGDIGVGVTVASGTTIFAINTGAWALIDRIELYIGGVSVSNNDDVSGYASIQRTNQSGSKARDILPILEGSNMDFTLNNANLITNPLSSYSILTAGSSPTFFASLIGILGFCTGVLTKGGKKIIGPLMSPQMVESKVELVVFWRTTAQIAGDCYNIPPAGGAVAPVTATNIYSPTLIVDYIQQPELYRQLAKSNDLQFFYSDVVHDFYNIPTAVNGFYQTTSFSPKGFSGQTLTDLVFAKRTASPANNTLGTKISTAMNSESLSITVNGVVILPQVVNTKALLKDYLETTKIADDLIVPIGADEMTTSFQNFNLIADATAQPVYGYLSYMGVNVNQLISSILVNYQRFGTNAGTGIGLIPIKLDMYGNCNRLCLATAKNLVEVVNQ